MYKGKFGDLGVLDLPLAALSTVRLSALPLLVIGLCGRAAACCMTWVFECLSDFTTTYSSARNNGTQGPC